MNMLVLQGHTYLIIQLTSGDYDDVACLQADHSLRSSMCPPMSLSVMLSWPRYVLWGTGAATVFIAVALNQHACSMQAMMDVVAVMAGCKRGQFVFCRTPVQWGEVAGVLRISGGHQCDIRIPNESGPQKLCWHDTQVTDTLCWVAALCLCACFL